MREVVLDTETTGLDPAEGHRIIEICCLELDNHLPTGRVYHTLVQPERDVPDEALRVHGLTSETLAGAPLFATIADDLLVFLADSRLVIHNAEFDIKFLNAELARLDRPMLSPARSIDTIALAKRRFPGARYSLDELCRRFNFDLSVRAKHGARIDAELLAKVYLELIDGRQARLALSPDEGSAPGLGFIRLPRLRPQPLAERISPQELIAHAGFVAVDIEGDVIWNWRA